MSDTTTSAPMPARDAWIVRRLLAGLDVDPAVDALAPRFRAVIERLMQTLVERRAELWDVALLGFGDDREPIIRALAAIDPEGPPPGDDDDDDPASLADLARSGRESRWTWKGYLPEGALAGIAAQEGIGKSRCALDLARRNWFAEPWPDGQPATFPAGTPTLWICSDGNQPELYEGAMAFGMPPESIFFSTPKSEPYGGTSIDEPEDLERLERYIRKVKPGLVFIDSLTFATSRDLCQANQVKMLMVPVRDIARRTNTTIVVLLHVAKDGDALGRRIKGLVRVMARLECPDPAKSERLRLSVPKSFDAKPQPLGVTMHDKGNDYDTNPPDAVAPAPMGRPSGRREDAKAFIRAALGGGVERIGIDLRKEFEESGGARKTFNRAKEEMSEDGELTERGGTGKGEQWMLRLVDPE